MLIRRKTLHVLNMLTVRVFRWHTAAITEPTDDTEPLVEVHYI